MRTCMHVYVYHKNTMNRTLHTDISIALGCAIKLKNFSDIESLDKFLPNLRS